jgi:arginase
MAEVELIGVPFDGYGRTGNQALAATVLREAGLVAAFGGHVVVAVDDLDLPAPSARRGSDTGLTNEAALIVMTDALNDRLGRAVSAGRFPVVYGADCSTLLGTVSGLRDRLGDVGLVFVDGHEDTMPLDVSEDGEAANAELGLLLGLTGQLLSGPLKQRLPALRSEALAILGPRDEAWRRQFNVGSLRDRGIWFRSHTDVAADPVEAGRGAAQHVQTEADRWWLHVDLDVLDPVHFEAQGLPDVDDEPGGLTWRQLTDLLIAAVETGGCLGWSLAIYDPDQDPDRTCARQIAELVGQIARTIR